MKVGIISEFKLDTVNFGNQLQAYALNYFLRNHLGIENVESIALGSKQMGQHTKVCSAAFAGKVMKLPQSCKSIRSRNRLTSGTVCRNSGIFRKRIFLSARGSFTKMKSAIRIMM